MNTTEPQYVWLLRSRSLSRPFDDFTLLGIYSAEDKARAAQRREDAREGDRFESKVTQHLVEGQ